MPVSACVNGSRGCRSGRDPRPLAQVSLSAEPLSGFPLRVLRTPQVFLGRGEGSCGALHDRARVRHSGRVSSCRLGVLRWYDARPWGDVFISRRDGV